MVKLSSKNPNSLYPIQILLLEPEYDANVGAICRIMKNFGFSDLIIINPKCSLELDAIKFSKHAISVLKSATILSSFEEAITDLDYVIGTSAIENRYKDTIRGIIPLSTFSKSILPKIKKKKLAIVFGREGTGLTSEEISLCDIIVKIETSPIYPTMNVSNAVAVILYAISLATHPDNKTKSSEVKLMEQNHKKAILKYISKISKKLEIRHPELVPLTFKRMLVRSLTTEKEAELLLILFRLLDERI